LASKAIARHHDCGRSYKIFPEEIAAIDDKPNDVLMFAQSGLSIAMGSTSAKFQRRSAQRL